jgi:hypothetical protein
MAARQTLVDLIRRSTLEAPAVVKGLELTVAGGSVVLAVGTALSLGHLPPIPSDPPAWAWLLWIVLGVGVVLLVIGLWSLALWVANGGLRSFRFVRSRAGELPRVHLVIERPAHNDRTSTQIAPPLPAILDTTVPAARVIKSSDLRTGAISNVRPTADDDEPTYKGKAQAIYVLGEYKKAVDSAKPYRERDPETPAIWSYKCPFCPFRSYTDQGALSMLTHIDRKHGDSTEGASEGEVRIDDADPPIDWTGQFWRGKQITPCAWDDYRTTSNENWNDHLETHTDPPTPQHEREVSLVPRQWAKQPIHYLGDGNHFYAGVPADPDHTLYVTEKYANELVASGLYDLGPVERQEHALVDAGPPPRCKCGHKARNTAWFQSHLHEKGV